MSTIKDFQILNKLGEGAFSSVFKAKRISDGQEYALKKVKIGGLSEKEKENALNEVRILASINDTNIIGYKEAFFEESPLTLCIVMEFAGGGDLYKHIVENQKKNTNIPERDVWRYLAQMCKGLKTLHDMNILHRDMKCANIFLSSDKSSIKLGDLNVSKVAKSALVYTQTGTPYYASPEVWKDQPYDKKSDIWSLGCVIYEVCSFKPPFRANDMKGLYNKVIKGVYDRIPSCYSQDLANVVAACLQVNPALRPGCDELLAMPEMARNCRDEVVTVPKKASKGNLLGTIKLPKNNIRGVQLPKAKYASMEHLDIPEVAEKETILPPITRTPGREPKKTERPRLYSGREASRQSVDAALPSKRNQSQDHINDTPKGHRLPPRQPPSNNLVKITNEILRPPFEERKMANVNNAAKPPMPMKPPVIANNYDRIADIKKTPQSAKGPDSKVSIPPTNNYYNKNLNYQGGTPDIYRPAQPTGVSVNYKPTYPNWWG